MNLEEELLPFLVSSVLRNDRSAIPDVVLLILLLILYLMLGKLEVILILNVIVKLYKTVTIIGSNKILIARTKCVYSVTWLYRQHWGLVNVGI